jgi:hypothetical protein
MNAGWRIAAALFLALVVESPAQRRFEPRVAERGRFDPPPLPPRAAEAFAGIERRHPDTDVYLAIQYGTRPTDIVYLYLNSARTEDARDLLYLFAPDEQGLIALKEISRGSPIATPARGGGGTVRGREFRIRGLESRVDDIRIRTDLTLISGYRQWDVLHLGAAVTMESPAGRSSHRIGGLLHPYVAIAPDGLKPLAVIGAPRFRAGPGKFDPSRLSASLAIGELPMMPGAGMGRDVRAVLTETGSGRVQQIRARWEDRPYLGVRPFEILTSLEARIKRGASYTLSAEIDLGPIFGVVKSESAFTVPLEEKK